MEAWGTGTSRGKHALGHQILGIDEHGENWAEHRDPRRALDMVKQRLNEATNDGLTLRYKFWIDTP